MAMTTLTIDIDEDELARLNEVCAARGMTVQQMIGSITRRIRMPAIFGKEAKKIRPKISYEDGRRAFEALRAQALTSPLADMSMEEIDAEIALARAERRAKRDK